MKKQRARWFSLILVLAMLASLAACGGKPADKTTKAAEGGEGTQAPAGPAGEETQGGGASAAEQVFKFFGGTLSDGL